MSKEFKIGDRVKLVSADYEPEGVQYKIYTIVENNGNPESCFCNMESLVELALVKDWQIDFELVNLSSSSKGEPNKQLGILRPNLEDRKVGKVRMELVDKGFPNTLWALAELLTWAQEAKGYKDHDWSNIPNALGQLPAAASRHRVRHNKGEMFDDESGKLHKLHELFGVMAECELLLTGDLK